ncbi:small integral membrane protein 1 [Microcaecilia unicolor]|uniref:Small integral membrane protein 1 n=1 Tax=Microcaecilia unicolor TaxID=1415580 RepID=A0A6P7WKL3_9AMPH|nr:small integral membrane protein 1 [Microcaecilia unicolor]
MQPQEGSGVQYSRWNNSAQDEVSVNTSTQGTAWNRFYTTLCTGRIGIAVKVLGGITLFWIIFIIGYVTGYYIHKCK